MLMQRRVTPGLWNRSRTSWDRVTAAKPLGRPAFHLTNHSTSPTVRQNASTSGEPKASKAMPVHSTPHQLLRLWIVFVSDQPPCDRAEWLRCILFTDIVAGIHGDLQGIHRVPFRAGICGQPLFPHVWHMDLSQQHRPHVRCLED